jgi:hypothetical protein
VKTKTEVKNGANMDGLKPTVFSQLMDIKCELHREMGLAPLPYWKEVRAQPTWAKNICGNFRNTILKSICKLRPGRKVNWRNYGRCIGLMERYKTFLNKDVPNLLKKDGLNKKLSKKNKKIFEAAVGMKEMRQYYLKVLGRSAKDRTPTLKLIEEALLKQLINLKTQNETAFYHLASQDAKTTKIFLKGMSEGYTIFLNEDGDFNGDVRRTDIHMELLAWQYDIEKMRKSVPPKTNKNLGNELKKLPEFKNKTQEWFNDVFKDIKLSIGIPGRPWQSSQV